MPRLKYMDIELREYRCEDYAAIAAWQNDPVVTRYLGTGFWFNRSESDVRDYLSTRMQGSHNAYYFVIARTENDDYLGQADLYGLDWRLRCASVGIIVTERGKGYGTKALTALCDFAFATLGLERIELELAADNLAAFKCYQNAGFSTEGIKRNACYYDGTFHDTIFMSMIRADWKTRRENPV